MCFPSRPVRMRPLFPLGRAAVAVAIAAATGCSHPNRRPFRRSGLRLPASTSAGTSHTTAGPATARLSVFPDAFFRRGSCTRKRIAGVRLLQVRIGARSLDGSSTNGGLPYFSLGLAGAGSRPKSGNVVAYYRSRRWVGRVGSFKSDEDRGTFVAQGIGGSRGDAHARFRCF